MPSIRELYEALTLDTLEQWVKDKRQEDLHLEFKDLPGGLDKDGRKNLAKAASGFANSDGGVVVWGVKAFKDGDDVDCAQELGPIKSVGAVLAALNEHTGQAVAPFVEGLEHRIVAETGGAGFLATFVPRSDGAPHMAGLGLGRYFKRSGSSFYPLEHFDIADMFGKRQRPELVVRLASRIVERHSDLHCYELVATIRNDGRVAARFLKAELEMPADVLGWPGPAPAKRDWPGEAWTETVRTLIPLFPGEVAKLTCHEWPYHMNPALFDRFKRNGWPTVNYRVFQEAGPPIEETFSFKELQNF